MPNVPAWLDENFFLKVLRTSQNDRNLSVSDNRVCVMIRSRNLKNYDDDKNV